jgi:DNA-binding NarL/FixJ family response regulator
MHGLDRSSLFNGEAGFASDVAAAEGSSRIVLTPRERDVVRGVAAGRTNKEIARALGLKEQGVKNVLSTVFLKCHVRNRLELALFVATNRGLTPARYGDSTIDSAP